MAFRKADGSFDIEAYEHAIRLWTVVLEIAVTMAQFPSRRIAQLSYEYRTLGLGYANIGGLLMASGIPYDSAAGRALCGALTAIMTGVSYATSAEMARELRPFPGYAANREAMLRVMRNHARAARARRTAMRVSPRRPCLSITPPAPIPRLLAHAVHAWERAIELGTAAWLPQCAGHGDRADRHDRAGDGLRHDRNRARLRAGEVQEARRRRLFQDHQPHGARGAARARLSRGGHQAHHRICRGPWHARRRSRRQSRDAGRQGLHARRRSPRSKRR